MTARTLPVRALPGGIWRRECVAELKRSWRLPQFLLPTIVTPGAFYGLFTLALAPDPTPASIAAGLAGYGVFAAIGPSLFGFGAGIAMEREQGLIELKRVSPMPTGAFLAAKLAAALVATALALALIYVLGTLGARRQGVGTKPSFRPVPLNDGYRQFRPFVRRCLVLPLTHKSAESSWAGFRR